MLLFEIFYLLKRSEDNRLFSKVILFFFSAKEFCEIPPGLSTGKKWTNVLNKVRQILLKHKNLFITVNME